MTNSSPRDPLTHDRFPIVGPNVADLPRVELSDPWATLEQLLLLVEQLNLPRRPFVPITGKFLL